MSEASERKGCGDVCQHIERYTVIPPRPKGDGRSVFK